MTRSAEPPRRPEPKRIDTRGLKCPWPVLRAARLMRDLDAILVLADDPVALTDMPALAEANGWDIAVRRCADHAEYFIQKRPIDPGC